MPLKEKVKMDIGSLYRTGPHVLLNVEEELKLFIENVSHLLKEEKTVRENLS